MSRREKVLLAIALALFALAHVGGAFVLAGASPPHEVGKAQLMHLGD
jgi:hypothetical protein